MLYFPNLSEEVEILRTLFERKKAGRWFEGGYGRVLRSLVLLLSISLISGCGASATTVTTTLPHAQPTVLAQPFPTTVQTFDKDFTLTLDITPNHSGSNRFSVQVMDNHTHKMATHIVITLYTTMQDMPMGTDSIVLHAGGGGQFSATSDVLSMGGHWAIGITIQTTDHVIHKAGVNFILPL